MNTENRLADKVGELPGFDCMALHFAYFISIIFSSLY